MVHARAGREAGGAGRHRARAGGHLPRDGQLLHVGHAGGSDPRRRRRAGRGRRRGGGRPGAQVHGRQRRRALRAARHRRTAQGIWVQGGARVHLSGLDVASNVGAGLSAKGTAGLIVEASSITGNGGAGILELAGTRDARYADNEIRGNGAGAATYNGDGIQLGGTGADVIANTITANGSSTFEHGIYTGAASAGWTIELNTLADNAGANVKATGGPGLIRRNRMTNGTFGLILSDNPAPVTAEHNVISGRAQHLVLLTSATTSARGRLWANTVVQYGRSTSFRGRLGGLRHRRDLARAARQPALLRGGGLARRRAVGQRPRAARQPRLRHQLGLRARCAVTSLRVGRAPDQPRGLAHELGPGRPQPDVVGAAVRRRPEGDLDELGHRPRRRPGPARGLRRRAAACRRAGRHRRLSGGLTGGYRAASVAR